ncbi:ATP-grasp ribosomal peptide maturase [Flavobacterium jejuense]|uniref:ATP-grasp ribosomal peptide maturase n=1 Tax=Flavobacterium jejuense TaxID=1544455 RepID=A0ABX0J154_9FLAO|nr:ATP-grasp ribosomal peptide maturase [Flavobacterium jejuense]NHN27926.1 ATP-grasp ribosomal peptide maturase [Flavobacterium jejuense]
MILCISHSKDYYTIDIVIKRLKELGENVYRLNSDDFSRKLSISYKNTLGEPILEIIDGSNHITSNLIEAVWYRKLWEITVPEDLDKSYKAIYLQEYNTMRTLFFDSLKNKVWINPIEIDHSIGANKVEQLRLAQKAGLIIPESVFTNNSEVVKHFFYNVCNKQVIAKLHGSLSRSMEGNTPFFPTTLVLEEHLQQLSDSLEYCPMIFQRKIEKQYELRVIYVDETFFVGKINATLSETGKIDWRATKEGNIGWDVYELPKDVCSSITKMMKSMGLLFGAIDVIRQKDGQYVFLEVNPQGEWGMLQRDLGYPIGETIAEKLVERRNKRKNIE